MAKASPVRRLTGDTFIVLRASYLQLCGGNVTAAALISYLEGFHTSIANEQELQKREQNPWAYWQYHSMKKLEIGLLGVGKRHSIDTARELLISMGVIECGRNPNPKFAFDATLHYLLKPDKLNELLTIAENSKWGPSAEKDKSEFVRNDKSEFVEKDTAIHSITDKDNLDHTNTPEQAPVLFQAEVNPVYKKFEDWMGVNCPRVQKMKEPITVEQWEQIAGWNDAVTVRDILLEMHNWEPLTKKNRSAFLTLKNWYAKRIKGTIGIDAAGNVTRTKPAAQGISAARDQALRDY